MNYLVKLRKTTDGNFSLGVPREIGRKLENNGDLQFNVELINGKIIYTEIGRHVKEAVEKSAEDEKRIRNEI